MKRIVLAILAVSIPSIAQQINPNQIKGAPKVVQNITGVDAGAQVNSFILGCGGNPCSIFIPAGSYTFTTPIVLASNVELFGAGRDLTTLLYTGTSGTPMSPGHTGVAGTPGIFAGASTANVKIRDLSIQGSIETVGTYASYNNLLGISIAGTNSVVDSVRVSHFWGYGACLNSVGSRNTVSNSISEYCTFQIGMTGDHLTAINNYISNHYSAASATEPPATIGYHYWDGFLAEGLSYSLIEGNTAEDNGSAGIYTGGGSSFSHDNRYANNHSRHNWGRGFDMGVSGDESATNANNNITMTANVGIDNNGGNFWLICNNNSRVIGNYSEFTSDYPTFFGSQADIGNRSGIALGDFCGTASADLASNNVVSGNTAIDYLGGGGVGLNFNTKATSIGNTFSANTNTGSFFINPLIDLTQNYIYDKTTIPLLITSPLTIMATSAQILLKFDATHSVGYSSDAAGNAFLNSTTHVFKFIDPTGTFDEFTVSPTGLSVNGNAGVTKTCTVLPTVVGGIITAC